MKLTWPHPKGYNKLEIDYIITPYLNIINKFKIQNKFPFYTELRLLYTEISIHSIRKRPRPE